MNNKNWLFVMHVYKFPYNFTEVLKSKKKKKRKKSIHIYYWTMLTELIHIVILP